MKPKVIHENYNGLESKVVIDFEDVLPFREEEYSYEFSKKKRNEKVKCFQITSDVVNKKHHISNSYFVGVDWIIENKVSLYVEPKFNHDSLQTNYLEMLFSALQHSDVFEHTEDLFEIKWDNTQILIDKEKDILTPLLVVQFLSVVRKIVKKGLKKSYYKVENNLFGKVKGKIQVGKTIKDNLLKNKPLNTICTYDEFGFNGLENRLIKKALTYVQRYISSIPNINSEKFTRSLFNYVNPAFDVVSEDVSINDVRYSKTNAFYREYEDGIRLAKEILQKFGYNISNINEEFECLTPPFWIDMSKLFELYVLGILKDTFKNSGTVDYHYTDAGNELDFLLNTEKYKMVVDAKYKPYKENPISKDDIRQVSGYARLKSVYHELGIEKNKLIDCLIIYPDTSISEKEILDDENLKTNDIPNYYGIFKKGIFLPRIKNEF